MNYTYCRISVVQNQEKYHRIVAHAEKAHHLHVGGDGAGTGKLGVGVHPAHGVGHAVTGGAGGHVVRVKRAARAAAGGHGEVLLSLLNALLLIGACHRMLRSRWMAFAVFRMD